MTSALTRLFLCFLSSSVLSVSLDFFISESRLCVILTT